MDEKEVKREVEIKENGTTYDFGLDNAYKSIKNRREHVKKVMKDAEKTVDDYKKSEDKLVKASGFKESVNVEDRNKLGKLIEGLKRKGLTSKDYKITRSKVEGFRYNVQYTKPLQESCHKKRLKESVYGEDVIDDLIDRARMSIDEGNSLDDAVWEAIDSGLIYSDDILSLAQHYEVIDDSELLDKYYEQLYDDIYRGVSDYANEEIEETYHITNAEWDIDESDYEDEGMTKEEYLEENDLPSEFDIDISYSRNDDVDEVLTDAISDEYGFTVLSYDSSLKEGLKENIKEGKEEGTHFNSVDDALFVVNKRAREVK